MPGCPRPSPPPTSLSFPFLCSPGLCPPDLCPPDLCPPDLCPPDPLPGLFQGPRSDHWSLAGRSLSRAFRVSPCLHTGVLSAILGTESRGIKDNHGTRMPPPPPRVTRLGRRSGWVRGFVRGCSLGHSWLQPEAWDTLAFLRAGHREAGGWSPRGWGGHQGQLSKSLAALMPPGAGVSPSSILAAPGPEPAPTAPPLHTTLGARGLGREPRPLTPSQPEPLSPTLQGAPSWLTQARPGPSTSLSRLRPRRARVAWTDWLAPPSGRRRTASWSCSPAAGAHRPWPGRC